SANRSRKAGVAPAALASPRSCALAAKMAGEADRMALAMAASARVFCNAGARANAPAAGRASRPGCRIVAASGVAFSDDRAPEPSSAVSGAFMALIRLAFVEFVTCPAKPSEAARQPRYAQQSTTFVNPSPNFRNLCGIWGVAARGVLTR